jgi:hypothetical protein
MIQSIQFTIKFIDSSMEEFICDGYIVSDKDNAYYFYNLVDGKQDIIMFAPMQNILWVKSS